MQKMYNKEIIVKNFPEDLGIRLIDMMRDPELIIKKIQQKIINSKVICFNCHKFMTFKFNATDYTIKCGCGVHIFYPPRSDRAFAYGHRFISAEQYKKEFD